jgi:hypothetical protein
MKSNYQSSEYTTVLLVVFFCIAVLLMAGAGWLDLDSMGAAIPVITAGATAIGYAISRSKVKAKREENAPYLEPLPTKGGEPVIVMGQKENEH